jgi:hypothetical protein
MGFQFLWFKSVGDGCELKGDKAIENATEYSVQREDIDDDKSSKKCLVKKCKVGFKPNAIRDECMADFQAEPQSQPQPQPQSEAEPEPQPYPTGFLMSDMKSVVGDKYISALGHLDRNGITDGYTRLIQNEDGTNVDNVKQCYERAAQIGGFKVIGVRTENHPTEGMGGTCFGYDDSYKNYVDGDNTVLKSADTHYMTCLDPAKSILAQECYQKPPTGFSMGGGFGRF